MIASLKYWHYFCRMGNHPTGWTLLYRVTHQVVTNLPWTSKQKFRFGLDRPGQNGTFVLKSTGGSSRPDVSPCTKTPHRMFCLYGKYCYNARLPSEHWFPRFRKEIRYCLTLLWWSTEAAKHNLKLLWITQMRFCRRKMELFTVKCEYSIIFFEVLHWWSSSVQCYSHTLTALSHNINPFKNYFHFCEKSSDFVLISLCGTVAIFRQC